MSVYASKPTIASSQKRPGGLLERWPKRSAAARSRIRTRRRPTLRDWRLSVPPRRQRSRRCPVADPGRTSAVVILVRAEPHGCDRRRIGCLVWLRLERDAAQRQHLERGETGRVGERGRRFRLLRGRRRDLFPPAPRAARYLLLLFLVVRVRALLSLFRHRTLLLGTGSFRSEEH